MVMRMVDITLVVNVKVHCLALQKCNLIYTSSLCCNGGPDAHVNPAAEVGMHVHHAAKVDVYAAYFDIIQCKLQFTMVM